MRSKKIITVQILRNLRIVKSVTRMTKMRKTVTVRKKAQNSLMMTKQTSEKFHGIKTVSLKDQL
jgi:hypothetical protein